MSNDTRCWRYRDGEARIFASPDDVPNGRGWVDSPAKVAVKAAKQKPKKQIEDDELDELERQIAELDKGSDDNGA